VRCDGDGGFLVLCGTAVLVVATMGNAISFLIFRQYNGMESNSITESCTVTGA
jgi:hypothetical protein